MTIYKQTFLRFYSEALHLKFLTMDGHTIPFDVVNAEDSQALGKVRLLPAVSGYKKPVPFLTILAHEVRNPLTNINLSIEMIRLELKNPELKVYLDIITRSSLRITELINDFLKYEQQDDLKDEKYDVCELLDEVIEMTKDRIRLKNITIEKEYTPEHCKILLNKPKMKIAFTNIIINAIDAMTAKKGKLSFITRSTENKYVLEIVDNGCGISKEHLKDIFLPYYTNKKGGLGLGLATTYDILRLNRVGVNVESEKGEGTRFMLSFDKKPAFGIFSK